MGVVLALVLERPTAIFVGDLELACLNGCVQHIAERKGFRPEPLGRFGPEIRRGCQDVPSPEIVVDLTMSGIEGHSDDLKL